MRSINPILVTGSHRSGSTWVGKVLSTSPQVGYIHEPFNVSNPYPGTCRANFDYWYTYVNRENEGPYYAGLKEALAFNFDLKGAIAAIDAPLDPLRVLRDFTLFKTYQLRNFRPLVKDPLALFSAPWLAERFGMDILLLVRHPAAFCGSLKKANWRFPFSSFLEQPLLLRDYLEPFQDDMIACAQSDTDIIEQACLLWRIIHYMILCYREQYPHWIVARHEDLSRDPLNGFETIFQALNLEFSPQVRQKISLYSLQGGNSTSASDDKAARIGSNEDLVRDSKSNIVSWKKRLTDQEIQLIHHRVSDISNHFYTDAEW